MSQIKPNNYDTVTSQCNNDCQTHLQDRNSELLYYKHICSHIRKTAQISFTSVGIHTSELKNEPCRSTDPGKFSLTVPIVHKGRNHKTITFIHVLWENKIQTFYLLILSYDFPGCSSGEVKKEIQCNFFSRTHGAVIQALPECFSIDMVLVPSGMDSTRKSLTLRLKSGPKKLLVLPQRNSDVTDWSG